jgi:hypothetical protein
LSDVKFEARPWRLSRTPCKQPPAASGQHHD